jgi:hypothetical protein
MGYATTKEAVRKSTYIGQTVISMCINFGINFGIAWATYSNWGKRKHDYNTWPSVGVWTWNYDVNSCIALDLFLTAFLMSFFCTLLATGGAQKDVKDKKCDVVEPALLQSGWWRWTPVRFRGLCFRSLMQGLFWVLVGWLPSIIVLSIAIRGETIPGLAWVIIKGLWAFFFALPIYSIVYFAALDKRNFPELEFEALMRLTGPPGIAADAPPLVGQVGRV